jgi:cobalt-zinc-cadmium efflux system outer membrane protein
MFLFLFLCVVLQAGYAQPVTDLKSLVDELVKNNPEIRASRYKFEAMSKRPAQVGAPPEPRLQLANIGVGQPFSRLNTSEFGYRAIGIAQEAPFPGKLALASEEARREAESELQMSQSVTLEMISRLKIAYFDWFQISKSIKITAKNRDLLERFEKIARARYSVGKGIQQDVLKAQVEMSGLEQQLELLEQRRASVEARIGALLNRPFDQPLGRPEEMKRSAFDMDLDTLLKLAQESSPELKSRQRMVDSRAVGVERARKEYRPDFNFSFQWQHTGSRFRDYYMAAAEVKLPVWYGRKQRYGVEEATSRLQESRQNYRAGQQDVLFRAKDEYLIAKTSERLLALYESGIIPQASLSLESALAGYEVGTVDFLTLINNLMSILTFERQYYEELARHEQALARLEPLVAKPLAQP